ncbi:MAG: hypothetical protein E6640_01650 [Actinomyces urogenitalis]|uniref:hypothetical protein n=1 Tax=Actinomyces urogenitalis TaxID=103621 RepID=UPI00290FB6E1|nr:hypothetical protein [Actinomyces urogenitalis]MDU6150915.1 hypothetical protein [Actinomyces urogenitalis]
MSTNQPRLANGRYTFKAAGAPVGTLEDPWAVPAPQPPSRIEHLRHTCERMGRALGGDEAELMSLYLETGIGVREELVRHVGQQVLDEAWERAGFDPDALAERVAQAKDTYNKAREASAKAYAAGMGLRRQIEDEWPRQSGESLTDWQARRATHPTWAEAQALIDASVAADKVADQAFKDMECRDTLTALSAAYRDTLSDIRPLGGAGVWHENTTAKAREAFDTAMGFYPTDWVETSNQSGPMLARISTRRAHYSHNNTVVTRKRVKVALPIDPAHLEDFLDDPYRRVVEADEVGGLAAGGGPYAVSQEVRPVYGEYNDYRPKGRGWERWTDSRGQAYWRRDRHRMKVVSVTSAPEILTDRSPSALLPGQEETTSTAVHELAHRFERTVGRITALEREHVHSRRTSAQTVRLYPGIRGNRERGFQADWASAYMGKDYHGQAWEVLSCSSEALFCGSYGGLVGAGRYNADPKSAAFAMGVLACAKAPGRKQPTVPGQERV